MRVPFHSFSQQFIQDLSGMNQKQLKLQEALSSGQRIQVASDDPGSMGRALHSSTEKARIQALGNNLNRAKMISNFTMETLEQVKGVTDNAIAVASTTDSFLQPGDFQARGLELNQLLEQGLRILNSEVAGEYLFAGGNSREQPFVEHRYTEFLEDGDGNYVDLAGNPLGPGDPPVPSVYVDANGDIMREPVMDGNGNVIPEGTYVDPATGHQTDASGVPLAGPVAITAGIDFNTGEVVEYHAETGTWEPILDGNGSVIVPGPGPDPSGTGNLTTTRQIPPEMVGNISYIEYRGTVSDADDVSFRVGENAFIAPWSKGSSNTEYAAFLSELIALRDAHTEESLDTVSDLVPNLNERQQEVTFDIVEFGAMLRGIEVTETINTSRFNQLEAVTAEELDINVAETLVELNQTQTAYEAALSSGARLMNLSILDYIS